MLNYSLSSVRLDMFQCQVRFGNTGKPLDMHGLYNALRDHMDLEDMRILAVYARSPGSLGQSVPTVATREWLIGSLSVRVYVASVASVYSVFVFNSGVVKVSGGSAPFQPTDDPDMFGSWLKRTVLEGVFSHVAFSTFLGEMGQVRLCLLNGTASLSTSLPLDHMSYGKICRSMLAKVERNVVEEDASTNPFIWARLPPVLDVSTPYTRGGGCGRISCMSLRYRDGGTVRFDHKHVVQFMGFRSASHINQAMIELLRLLHACAPVFGYKVCRKAPSRLSSTRSSSVSGRRSRVTVTSPLSQESDRLSVARSTAKAGTAGGATSEASSLSQLPESAAPRLSDCTILGTVIL